MSATVIQLVCIVAVIVVVMLVAVAKASTEVSYLTAVVASQLLSPMLWDHYAVLLLLPVAWLLQRRPLVGHRDPAPDVHPVDPVAAAGRLPRGLHDGAARPARRGPDGPSAIGRCGQRRCRARRR